MKKIIGILVVGAVVVFLVLGILRSRQTEEVESISDIQQREGVPVQVGEIGTGDVRMVRSYYGTINARHQALISSKLLERIDRIFVSEGDRVRKGQVLVQMDTTANQASVAQARMQYSNAKRDYERMKNLLAEGAISQQQFDQAELGFNVAERNYLSSLRSVELTAPIDGIVARVEFEDGQVAGPGDVILKLVSEEAYQVEFDLTQEDRSLVVPGQAVTIKISGKPDLQGTVRQVSLAASEFTRLFKAKADVPAAQWIYPGVLATVEVVVDERQNVTAVPVDAILERNGSKYIVTVSNGSAALQQVQTGLEGEELVEILSGARPGQRIALYGHTNLVDGDKVQVVEQIDKENA